MIGIANVIPKNMKSIIDTIDPSLWQQINDSPQKLFIFIMFVVMAIVLVILIVAAYLALVWICLKISRKIFKSIEKKQGKKIHLQFAESLVQIAIIILFFVVPLAGDEIRQSILGSAAVMAAIVGIACQDIIKDTLSGLMISIYKPFDLGDRIELEDGTAGIVESITMRHVVLILIDTVRLVVPNSKLNISSIKNYSYDYVPRSADFTFPVSYETDVSRAKEVIYEAIKQSEHSVPGKKNKDGENVYGPVYFISLSDSAFNLKVTVYYNPGTPTESLKDDINTRVVEALSRNGIEIPYNYANVVLKHDVEQ